MATFDMKVKNKVDIGKKPRVYFTCHPDDFEKYFNMVCEDIFKTHDCAIYYTKDMTKSIAEDERAIDLGRNNLFVVPVTYKLLTTHNRAMDEDIPYALKSGKPVLPIMMESGIDEFYSKEDKFGELQYLNPYSNDLTEISYEEKLKKYLESVLISDELARRVRAAFDAYIFLSYRKKDRKYANELMRLIHSNPECRDIAIWFDEFLTPGESFKKSIEKILENCKLFTLLVTPHILEKVVDENGIEHDNYVISTELPLAQKNKREKGSDIFAVEMEKTDKNALLEIDIEDYVNSNDKAFRTRLLESVAKMAITSNDTPEHDFLIGLAYLEGIDVEVDRKKGLELIEKAADNNLIEAMEKLEDMYYNGIGVGYNYTLAAQWCERVVDYYERNYGKEDPKALSAKNNLAITYRTMGDSKRGCQILKEVYESRCNGLGEEDPKTLTSLNNWAMCLRDIGDYAAALELQEKAHSLTVKVFGEDSKKTYMSLNNLSYIYSDNGNDEKALKLSKEAYNKISEICGEEHQDAVMILNNMAVISAKIGSFDKALEAQKMAFTASLKNLGGDHPQMIIISSNLALSYCDIGDYNKAQYILLEALKKARNILGNKHPNTALVLENLAFVYYKMGIFKECEKNQSEAYALQCAIWGEKYPKAVISLNNYIGACKKTNNLEKLVELQEKKYLLTRETLGEKDITTLGALNDLAVTYGALKNHLKARELQEKVYNASVEVCGESNINTIMALCNLGVSYYNCKNKEKATELLEKAYRISCEALGKDHPQSIMIFNNLQNL